MIDKSLFPRFFAAHRRACLALGLKTKEDQNTYYRKVCLEEARVMSVKDISTMTDFDKCLARFASDGGDFRAAVDYDFEKQKRRAYVCRVMASQIMQLEGFEKHDSRAYIEGILERAGIGSGFRAAGASFWMDLSAASLWKCLQILDTHLRRLKSRLGCPPPLSFNDRVAFHWNGRVLVVEQVEKYYYTKTGNTHETLEKYGDCSTWNNKKL